MSKNNLKGILKKQGEDEDPTTSGQNRTATFDEMNVLATHHPPGKDYGFMIIDEPKTPYHNDDGVELLNLDPKDLTKRLLADKDNTLPSVLNKSASVTSTASNDTVNKTFSDARKAHYNMKDQMQKGRSLLDEIDDYDVDDYDDYNDDDG